LYVYKNELEFYPEFQLTSEPLHIDCVVIKKTEDVGWTAKWEARGRAEGEAKGRAEGEIHKALDIAQNMVNLGLPLETVVSATQLDIEEVRPLYKKKE
jgi:predicted transposase YdaD